MNASAIISLCSLALALIVFLSNRNKDSRTDAAREARTEAKLDNITNGVSEIRVDFRTMRKEMDEHKTAITRLQDGEREHTRRIETLEKKFNEAHPPA